MKFVTPAMVERYLKNTTEEAKDQAIRFILNSNNPMDIIDSVGFLLLQVEDMARMYPEFKNETLEVSNTKN